MSPEGNECGKAVTQGVKAVLRGSVCLLAAGNAPMREHRVFLSAGLCVRRSVSYFFQVRIRKPSSIVMTQRECGEAGVKLASV